MTKDSRAIVLSFAYSLSPKVQHAAVALEDRYDTLEWLLNQGNGSLLGANPSKIAVVGDSVGETFAALCL